MVKLGVSDAAHGPDLPHVESSHPACWATGRVPEIVGGGTRQEYGLPHYLGPPKAL